jgi:hypothetical protein
MAALTVSWQHRSTGGCTGVHADACTRPVPVRHATSAGPDGGPRVEACGISPCDGDADPSYGGDAGVTRLRTPAGVASWRAPLLCGRGGRSVTRVTR